MTAPTLDELLTMRVRDLHALFTEGHPVDPRQLAGFEFHGTSLGVPRWVEKLAWKRFKKVFYLDEQQDLLRGWNLAVSQTDGKWTTIQTEDGPKAYGHYVVRLPDPAPEQPPGAIWLDYGCPHRALQPTTWLRDPVISLNPNEPERLLGFSMMKLGPRLVRTPSFFHLRRGSVIETVLDPPT